MSLTQSCKSCYIYNSFIAAMLERREIYERYFNQTKHCTKLIISL